jgi:acyl carrier protein
VSNRTPAAPLTQEGLEEWVVSACTGLGLTTTDADSDFFEAGGNSLTAIRLISQAEEAFGDDVLPPEDLFAESTVRQIAATILRNARG